MDRLERYELTDGVGYRGHTYFLTGFVEPPPDDGGGYDPDEDADAWGASIARRIVYTDEEDRVVHTEYEEIVCMDTRHGDPHVDRKFLSRPRWPEGLARRRMAIQRDETVSRGKLEGIRRRSEEVRVDSTLSPSVLRDPPGRCPRRGTGNAPAGHLNPMGRHLPHEWVPSRHSRIARRRAPTACAPPIPCYWHPTSTPTG